MDNPTPPATPDQATHESVTVASPPPEIPTALELYAQSIVDLRGQISNGQGLLAGLDTEVAAITVEIGNTLLPANKLNLIKARSILMVQRATIVEQNSVLVNMAFRSIETLERLQSERTAAAAAAKNKPARTRKKPAKVIELSIPDGTPDDVASLVRGLI